MTASTNHVQLTRELLHFNTINPPGMERACARYLGAMLEEAGFRCSYHEFAASRTSLVAEIGGRVEDYPDQPPICFTGHIDTVPLGAAPWSKDAFAGETAGDQMFGRGVSDMKRDRKSTRLNSSHIQKSRMPSSA